MSFCIPTNIPSQSSSSSASSAKFHSHPPKLTSTQKSNTQKSPETVVLPASQKRQRMDETLEITSLNKIFEKETIELMSKSDIKEIATRTVQYIFTKLKTTGEFPDKIGFGLTQGFENRYFIKVTS